MTDWNQVEATVSIGGSECKFTTIYLKQVFNGHHVLILVCCVPSAWRECLVQRA